MNNQPMLIIGAIVLSSTLGVFLLLFRSIFGLIAALLGFQIPIWFWIAGLVLLCLLVILFPFATGRLATALLAKRAGFLSFKIGKVDLWGWRVEDLVLESSSYIINIKSFSLRIDVRKRHIKLELSLVQIDIRPPQPLGTESSLPGIKRKKRPSALSPLSLLKFIRVLQLNMDVIEITTRGFQARMRDFTGSIRLGTLDVKTKIPSIYQRLAVDVSFGRLSLFTLLNEMDNEDKRATNKKLNEEDDLFAGVDNDKLLKTNNDVTPKLEKTGSKRELRSSKAPPPLFDLAMCSLLFHIKSTEDLNAEEPSLVVCKGTAVSFQSVKISLSSANMIHCLKHARAVSSTIQSPAAPAPSPVPENKPHPIIVALTFMQTIRADPFSLHIGNVGMDLSDFQGPCISYACSYALTMDSSPLHVVSMTITKPTISSTTSFSSFVVEDKTPMLSLASATIEMSVGEDLSSIVTAVLLTSVRVDIHPQSLIGLERSHLECLRFLRGVPQNNATLTKKHLVPNTAQYNIFTKFEFAITDRVIILIKPKNGLVPAANNDPDLQLQCLTFSTSVNVLSNSTGKIGIQMIESLDVKCEEINCLIDDLSSNSIFRVESVSANLVNAQQVHFYVEDVASTLAMASAVRAYRTYRQFSPRLSHWKEESAVLRAVINAESTTTTTTTMTGGVLTKKKKMSFDCELENVRITAMLSIEGRGVMLVLPVTRFAFNPNNNNNNNKNHPESEVKMQRLRVECFKSFETKTPFPLLEVAVLSVHSMKVVDVQKLTVMLSASNQPFLGELLTDYFTQRKALLLAVKEVDDLNMANTNSTNLAVDNSSAKQSSLPDRLGPTSVISSEDIDKIALQVSLTDVSILLEDDEVEDDPKYACRGFFPMERRKLGSPRKKHGPFDKTILRVHLKSLVSSFALMTAWKSRAGPVTDSSLIRRTPAKQYRTRAYLLKMLVRADSLSCPQSRTDAALVHGMADLVGIELSKCHLESISVHLSDYPLPWVSVSSLSLTNDEDPFGHVLFSDLRAVQSSTRQIKVTLSECSPISPITKKLSHIVVNSTSSFVPMKVYFDLPQIKCDNVSASTGECLNPGLVALDRALLRALPASSDKLSPKLGWWDKMRYLVHGRSTIQVVNGLDIRFFVTTPHLPDNYVLFTSSEAHVTDFVDDETNPELGIDVRAWEALFTDFGVKLSHAEHEDGRVWKFLSIPKLRLLLSLAWRGRYGGDHYVQLHHANSPSVDQVPDQFAYFRSLALDLGLDFDCKRLFGKDFFVKDRYPALDICWRPCYPLLCACYRGVNPPVPPNLVNGIPNLGRILTRIAFNVRADRPHIVWSEDRKAQIAFLLRGKTVDSRVVLNKEGVRWIHESVLSQYAAVEASMMNRVKAKNTSLFASSWGDEFGIHEGTAYAYGIGLPTEPFFVTPAMRLTLGLWMSLQIIDLDSPPPTLPPVSSPEGEDVSKTAYRLCVDEAKLLWTLEVRNETFRFLSTVAYIMRKEARVHDNISSQFQSSFNQQQQSGSGGSGNNNNSSSNDNHNNKQRTRRMNLSWLWNRHKSFMPSAVTPGSSPTHHHHHHNNNNNLRSMSGENIHPPVSDPVVKRLLEKFPTMSSKMALFLSQKLAAATSSSSPTRIYEEETSLSGSDLETSQWDRRPPCSSSQVSADGLKSTWDEDCRDFTLELRWCQVSLSSGRSNVILTGKSGTIRDFRLGLIDFDSPTSECSLWRKEVDVEVRHAQMFAIALSNENNSPNSQARFLKSDRPMDTKLCVLDSEFDYSFVTARGAVRRVHSNQSFTDRVSFLLSANVGPEFYDNEEMCLRVLNDWKIKRNQLYDICSEQQDPQVSKVAFTDGFHVTDVVYTDTSGGAKVPSKHLGFKVQKCDAHVNSRDFFVVLVVIRDLILVGPPPDVEELAVLAEQEAQLELKRQWKMLHPNQETTDGNMEEGSKIPPPPSSLVVGGEIDMKGLQNYVELVCSSRPKMLVGISQRIVYEVGECRLNLYEPTGVEKLQAVVTGYRGDHLFSLDGSTAVEFEVVDLSVRDSTTNQQIVECQVLDTKTPFLRADAITSAPIICLGHRVTVYEMLQIHLFPGSRYRFRMKVSQNIASFVRKFFVEEGVDDAENRQLMNNELNPLASANLSPNDSTLLTPQRSSDQVDLINVSQLSITDGPLPGAVAGAATLASTEVATSVSRPENRYKRISTVMKSVFSSSSSSNLHKHSTITAGSAGELPAPGVVAAASGEVSTNSMPSSTSTTPSSSSLSAKAAATTLARPPLQHRDSRLRKANDRYDEEEDDDNMSDEEGKDKPMIESQLVLLQDKLPPNKNNTSKNSLVVRSGLINRLSVPKPLQAHPEPTVQIWSSTLKRKNVLNLVVRNKEGFLEMHRNEMGIKFKITPRAVVKLSDIYRIRRSKDTTAPLHAVDIFYKVLSHLVNHEARAGSSSQKANNTSVMNLGMDGEGVFTWAAEEHGWSGKDAALPWVAAMAPGLNIGVLEPELEKEIQKPDLEFIVKRSMSIMKRPSDVSIIGKRNLQSVNNDDTDDDSVHSGVETNQVGGNAAPPAGAPLSPHAATTATATEFFPIETLIQPPQTTISDSAITTTNTKQAHLIDIAYFKFARVGQIQLDLNLQGFAFINNLQRNAFCTPSVYHRELWTWSKAFRIVQRNAIKKLLTSAVRGGADTVDGLAKSEADPIINNKYELLFGKT